MQVITKSGAPYLQHGNGNDREAAQAPHFARLVVFAMSQPDDVDMNEILFRTTRQEL
jgi:NADP-dependent 3-hydroxy acid dehydrogenase YdfG